MDDEVSSRGFSFRLCVETLCDTLLLRDFINTEIRKETYFRLTILRNLNYFVYVSKKLLQLPTNLRWAKYVFSYGFTENDN